MVSQEVMASIVQAYGSLEDPTFFFVSSAVDDDPYRAIVDRLEQTFEVEEDTDPDDDVSFGYLLRRGSRDWVLRLSMVGPYGMLLRDPEGRPEVVTGVVGPRSDDEAAIVRVVREGGVTLLGSDALAESVPLRLLDADEDALLYQALFTETDFLPWEPLPAELADE